MCDITEGLKLCTCNINNEKQLTDKPYWILSRKVPRKKDQYGDHIVGEYSVDFLYGSELRAFILNELRSRNCFDQDLNLKQKDKLDIVTATETYSYELRKNGWQVFHPELPRAKHNEYAKGKLVSS
jgi:hypothetical protein